jgi:hypothetical protein
MNTEWYRLPSAEYNVTFLKALAIASHMKLLDPSELQYFFDQNWTQLEIAKELYNRIKSKHVSS